MNSTELVLTLSVSCIGFGFTSLLITSTISGKPSITQRIAKVRCDGLATADRGIMAAFLTPLYLQIKEGVLCIVCSFCSQWLSLRCRWEVGAPETKLSAVAGNVTIQ
jgi:hypothetical protein